jgi:hypothetical protein
VQVHNTDVLNTLRAQQYDVAFAHIYDLCPFGLIHMLNVSGRRASEHMVYLRADPVDHMAVRIGAQRNHHRNIGHTESAQLCAGFEGGVRECV